MKICLSLEGVAECIALELAEIVRRVGLRGHVIHMRAWPHQEHVPGVSGVAHERAFASTSASRARARNAGDRRCWSMTSNPHQEPVQRVLGRQHLPAQAHPKQCKEYRRHAPY